MARIHTAVVMLLLVVTFCHVENYGAEAGRVLLDKPGGKEPETPKEVKEPKETDTVDAGFARLARLERGPDTSKDDDGGDRRRRH